MPEHDIEITLPSKPLANVDMTLVIKSDGKKLGELHVSKGSADWKPARRRTAKTISWERLAQLMDDA